MPSLLVCSVLSQFSIFSPFSVFWNEKYFKSRFQTSILIVQHPNTSQNFQQLRTHSLKMFISFERFLGTGKLNLFLSGGAYHGYVIFKLKLFCNVKVYVIKMHFYIMFYNFMVRASVKRLSF